MLQLMCRRLGRQAFERSPFHMLSCSHKKPRQFTPIFALRFHRGVIFRSSCCLCRPTVANGKRVSGLKWRGYSLRIIAANYQEGFFAQSHDLRGICIYIAPDRPIKTCIAHGTTLPTACPGSFFFGAVPGPQAPRRESSRPPARRAQAAVIHTQACCYSPTLLRFSFMHGANCDSNAATSLN
jgi:hypothetical protein